MRFRAIRRKARHFLAVSNIRPGLNNARRVGQSSHKDGPTHIVISPPEFMQATRRAGAPSALTSHPLPCPVLHARNKQKPHSVPAMSLRVSSSLFSGLRARTYSSISVMIFDIDASSPSSFSEFYRR
jgi:hypothetical protein